MGREPLWSSFAWSRFGHELDIFLISASWFVFTNQQTTLRGGSTERVSCSLIGGKICITSSSLLSSSLWSSSSSLFSVSNTFLWFSFETAAPNKLGWIQTQTDFHWIALFFVRQTLHGNIRADWKYTWTEIPRRFFPLVFCWTSVSADGSYSVTPPACTPKPDSQQPAGAGLGTKQKTLN